MPKNKLSKGLRQNNSDIVTRIIFAGSTWVIPKTLLKNTFETFEWWKTIYNYVPECLKVFKALSSLKESLAFTKHSLKELNCVLMLPACPKNPIYFNGLPSLGWLFFCSESLQNWSRFLLSGKTICQWVKKYCLLNFSERQEEKTEWKCS